MSKPTEGSLLIAEPTFREEGNSIRANLCDTLRIFALSLNFLNPSPIEPYLRMFGTALAMPMQYEFTAIPDSAIPRAASALFQHVLDIYASETNKVVSVWREFAPTEVSFRPHPRSSTVLEILKHQLLSERRFFGEFLGVPEPPATEVLPRSETPQAYVERMVELALRRLSFFARQDPVWWLARVPFFDVERERIWIFWRRVLHTTHHRTQLTVYLRLLGKPVPATYGPTADVTWKGADPTHTVDAAGRK